MKERLKDFIARRVFHPLEGMLFEDWWRLLGRHHFAVDVRHWPRALVQTAVSLSNSVTARLEQRQYGHHAELAHVQAPLFILGHYRSGTTHLHNLIGLDPQFAFPTFFQVLNPHTFLITERWAAPVSDRLMIHRRYQDELPLSSGVPSEDEVALGTMTGLSPYMGWYFSRGGGVYDPYLTFRGVPDHDIAHWGDALTKFLKKLTLRYGRPLVLKSPPHTARIRLLLELFPDARFVHICRNPYEVFQSTRHMIRSVQPIFRFQEGPLWDSDDRILRIYTELYDAYFEQRGLIPVGRLCEVGFEELEREPLKVIGAVYQALGLTGFDELRPRLESYLASIAGYRKNRLDCLPELLRQRIAQAWGRSFDAWAYER